MPLFPGTPIVFCGVNEIQVENELDRNIFTGIFEVTAERDTLNLALRLHPETKKVFIICGNTPSGRSRWKQVERMFVDYPQLQFIRLDSSLSMQEIKWMLEKLSRGWPIHRVHLQAPGDKVNVITILTTQETTQACTAGMMTGAGGTVTVGPSVSG